jgi:putative ABC transport system ATP-binding protein
MAAEGSNSARKDREKPASRPHDDFAAWHVRLPAPYRGERSGISQVDGATGMQSMSTSLHAASGVNTMDAKAIPAASSSPDLIGLDAVDLSLGRGPSRVHILKSVSMAIGQGEAVGLTGPSGSGKSTLLMVMAGLERPDSGSVIVAGENLAALDEDRLALFRGRRIGIVFQSFHLVPTMTARENVALPLELAGRKDAFSRAELELRNVGLGDRLDHYPAQLSGGEQQRVAIARAIAPDPAILVADEPTGNLDDTTGRSIVDLIFALKRERHATLVLVTHDGELAAACDRTVRLRSGQIVDSPAMVA